MEKEGSCRYYFYIFALRQYSVDWCRSDVPIEHPSIKQWYIWHSANHFSASFLTSSHFSTTSFPYMNRYWSTLILINIPIPGHWPQSSHSSALPFAGWRSLRGFLYRRTLARNRDLSGHRDDLNKRSRHQYCLTQGKKNIELTADMFWRTIKYNPSTNIKSYHCHVQPPDSARNTIGPPGLLAQYTKNLLTE